MRQAWVIHNPAAGRFPAEPLVRRAASVLAGCGWSVQTHTSHEREELAALVRQARDLGAAAVIVAGGDGTVGLAASLLRESPTALGVLPTGTANVWAQEVGTPTLNWTRPTQVDEIARSLAEGEVRPVDLGEANGRAFLLWAGTGLDARVVHMVEPRHRIDKLLPTTLYAVHTLLSAQGWDGIDLEVVWPGGRVRGRFLLAVACNVGSYGGGLLRLAPKARVDDGLLDFWIIEGRTVLDTVTRILQIARGEHQRQAGFLSFRAAEAQISSNASMPMHFDGEPASLSGPIDVRVLPGALRVLVPRPIPAQLFASVDDGQLHEAQVG
jgi:diacylglycerol kinase (ATP)